MAELLIGLRTVIPILPFKPLKHTEGWDITLPSPRFL